MSYPPSGREIAEHLCISPARVSQLKADGLPTDSLEAAERWYRRNVDQVRSVGQRLTRGAPVPKWARPGPAAEPRDRAAALEHAAALGTAGHYALAAGAFELVEPALRAALRAIAPGDRSRLEMPDDVWDALTVAVLEDIKAHEEPGDFVDEMSDEDLQYMAAFWYQVAAGELGLRGDD